MVANKGLGLHDSIVLLTPSDIGDVLETGVASNLASTTEIVHHNGHIGSRNLRSSSERNPTSEPNSHFWGVPGTRL